MASCKAAVTTNIRIWGMNDSPKLEIERFASKVTESSRTLDIKIGQIWFAFSNVILVNIKIMPLTCGLSKESYKSSNVK